MAGEPEPVRIKVEADTAEATQRILELRKAMEDPVAHGITDALKGMVGSRKFLAPFVYGGLALLNQLMIKHLGVGLTDEQVAIVGNGILAAVALEGGRDLVATWKGKAALAQALPPVPPAPPTAPPAAGGEGG